MTTQEVFSHEPIVLDMVDDAMHHLEGMNRRFDKLFKQNHDQLARISMQLAVPQTFRSFELYQEDFDRPMSEDELFEEKIQSAASAVGICVLVAIENSGRFKPGYMYNNKLRIPFDDDRKKTSALGWIEDVWAPTYAVQFAEATTHGLAKKSTEVVE